VHINFSMVLKSIKKAKNLIKRAITSTPYQFIINGSTVTKSKGFNILSVKYFIFQPCPKSLSFLTSSTQPLQLKNFTYYKHFITAIARSQQCLSSHTLYSAPTRKTSHLRNFIVELAKKTNFFN